MTKSTTLAAIALVVAGCGGHRHGPSTNTNPNTLFVEIHTGDDYSRALRSGAAAGLSRIRFVVPADRGGEIELQVEVSKLQTAGNQTMCSVKILVLRLPQHDLLGIADGSARAGGTDDDAAEDCVEQLGASLVASKVRTLLRRRLDLKR